MAKSNAATPAKPATANPAKPTAAKPTAKVENVAPKAAKYPNFGIQVFAKPETLKIPGDKLSEAAKALDAIFPNLVKFNPPMQMETAKEFLGWETEADYVAKLKKTDPNINEDAIKFGGNYFLTDRLGNKVRLHLNTRNRPWGENVSEAYMQDLLKKHWEFNGETIILGEYARDLSGQHRLIGLVFAEQERTKDDNSQAHWSEFWEGPVEMECIVITGISESPKVTRTLDNVKSRTLSDVIYADTELFGSLTSAAEKKTASKMLDYAVRFLWGRGGENKDQWAPKRTHSESLAFVDHHTRLKECVKHILEEEKDGRISKFIYPGHAAALLYLMGHAGTPQADIEDYMVKRPTDEKGLKWGSFKKAKMFWSELARDAEEFKNLRLARRPLPNDDDGFSGFVFAESDDGGGSFDERVGMLILAWENFRKDQPLEGLELTYETVTDPETNVKYFTLKQFPTVQESIDVGKPQPKPKAAKKTEELSALEELGEEGEEGEGETTETPTLPKPSPKADVKDAARKEWDELKKTYGDNHILIMKSTAGSGNYKVIFDDAVQTGKITGARVFTHPASGVAQIVIGEKELDEFASKLSGAGLNVLILERDGGKWNAKPYVSAEDSFNDPAETQADADVPTEGEESATEASEEQPEATPEEPAPEPAKPANGNSGAKKMVVKRKS